MLSHCTLMAPTHDLNRTRRKVQIDVVARILIAFTRETVRSKFVSFPGRSTDRVILDISDVTSPFT